MAQWVSHLSGALLSQRYLVEFALHVINAGVLLLVASYYNRVDIKSRLNEIGASTGRSYINYVL